MNEFDPNSALDKARKALRAGRFDTAALQYELIDESLSKGGSLPEMWTRVNPGTNFEGKRY